MLTYVFYLVAAVLAALKIAGLYAGSWYLIVGIALVPWAFVALVLMVTGLLFTIAHVAGKR